MKKMLNSKQVNTRLPIHMVQQIKFVARERGVTDGSIIEAALREFLGKTEHEEILLKKTDKISRQIERMRRESKVLVEVVTAFIRVYLTHVREIPEAEKPAAERKGAQKFSRFIKIVSQALDNSKPFIDELEERRFKKENFVQ